MNMLAHLFLSGHKPGWQVGNFIGDQVKGRAWALLPVAIGQGVVLHRHIDSFTDRHPLVRAALPLFRPAMGRYAGVVLDVVYDHLLAANWGRFSAEHLQSYSDACFANLRAHWVYLPSRVQAFLPHMQAANRLVAYAHTEGLADALYRMTQYAGLPPQIEQVLDALALHRVVLESDFFLFFDQLQSYVQQYLMQLDTECTVEDL